MHHLLVLDEGAVVGVISCGDVVKSIVSEQHFTINNLVQYIMGGRRRSTSCLRDWCNVGSQKGVKIPCGG